MPKVTADELDFNKRGYAYLGVTVKDCRVLQPEDGKAPSINFAFETIDGRHAYADKYLSQNALQYTQGTMREAFGFEGPLDELLVAVQRGDFIGADCTISLKSETWEGEERLKVSGIWPARKKATNDDLRDICAGLGYEFKQPTTTTEPPRASGIDEAYDGSAGTDFGSTPNGQPPEQKPPDDDLPF